MSPSTSTRPQLDTDSGHSTPVRAEQIAQQQRIAEAAASQAHALEQLASVPEPVKRYLISLWSLLNQQNPNLAEIHSAYEQGWNRLSDKFFPKQEWPDAEVIAPLVNHDEVFLTLYRELYYRHIIARLQPDLRDRIASYEASFPGRYLENDYLLTTLNPRHQAYCNLFNLILNSSGPVPLTLPIDWIYNMSVSPAKDEPPASR